MNKPFDFNSSDYVTEKLGDDWYATIRVTPFTKTEKRLIRQQNRKLKKGITINLKSTDTPEQIAEKTRRKIRERME